MAVARTSLELTARGRVVAGLAAASLLGGWLSGDPNVRIAAGLLVAPLVVDFARKPRSLGDVRLHVAPRRTVVGAPFHEEVQVDNVGRTPLREVLMRERRTRGLPALVHRVAPGGATTAVLACHSLERSHLLERVFELWTDWPLGMLRSRATTVVATDMVTEPRRVPLATRMLRAIDELQPSPNTRSHLQGDEYHALREHQPTEDARGVHALRSAALGMLVHTVVRGRLPSQVGVVLDLRRPPGRSLHLGHRRFEWSLGACATMIDRLRAGDCVVRMWVHGTETLRATVADATRQRELLTLLAEVGASPYRPLDTGALDELQILEHCFWIPAGGYLARADLGRLRPKIHVLGGGDA